MPFSHSGSQIIHRNNLQGVSLLKLFLLNSWSLEDGWDRKQQFGQQTASCSSISLEPVLLISGLAMRQHHVGMTEQSAVATPHLLLPKKPSRGSWRSSSLMIYYSELQVWLRRHSLKPISDFTACMLREKERQMREWVERESEREREREMREDERVRVHVSLLFSFGHASK